MGNNLGMNMLSGGGGSQGSGGAGHRPMVGGGPAAAYEAARADHYRK